MDEGLTFSVSLDKKLHSDLLLLALCPTQDLVACCFSDHISCHRLNWQKVWSYQCDDEGEPTAICWHPEALLIIIGFKEGALLALDTEQGALKSVTKGPHCISSLSWLETEHGPHTGMSKHQCTVSHH